MIGQPWQLRAQASGERRHVYRCLGQVESQLPGSTESCACGSRKYTYGGPSKMLSAHVPILFLILNARYAYKRHNILSTLSLPVHSWFGDAVIDEEDRRSDSAFSVKLTLTLAYTLDFTKAFENFGSPH